MRRRIFVRRALFILAILGMVGFAIRQWSINVVIRAAERTANGNPYCVQVTGESWDREIRELGDLSIFNMPVRYFGSSVTGHHAVMAVETSERLLLFHWSYWEQDFIPGIIGPPALYCRPESGYLHLHNRSSFSDASFVRFRSDEMVFSVPRAFRPSASAREVSFYSIAPTFTPHRWRQEDARITAEDINFLVEVNFGETGRSDSWLHKPGESYVVEVRGKENGLNKHVVWYLPSAKRSKAYTPSEDYFVRSPEGRITTLISCPGGTAGDCLHTFYDQGWTYTFKHKKSLLPIWRNMHKRLTALTTSFVISNRLVSYENSTESHRVFEWPLIQDKSATQPEGPQAQTTP